MKCRPEHMLLFLASISGHDEFIKTRISEIVRDSVDWEYLKNSAEALGVARGVLERLLQAGIIENSITSQLHKIAQHEMQKSESLSALYQQISSLLAKNGFNYIPLKGCDQRISKGARKLFNPMDDIDILVRISDIEDIAQLLEENEYHYQGMFSGSHINFFTDEEIPRLIEIHWDLVNRSSPVQKILFHPSIDGIWDRSISMGGESHLSLEDVLSYLTAHCIKEYFHKPKWLTDIVWILEHCSNEIDHLTAKMVMSEWGTSRALGIIVQGVKEILYESSFNKAWDFGACKPGLLGLYVAQHLLCYDKLRNLRPLLFVASAESLSSAFEVSAGMFKRFFRL